MQREMRSLDSLGLVDRDGSDKIPARRSRRVSAWLKEIEIKFLSGKKSRKLFSFCVSVSLLLA